MMETLEEKIASYRQLVLDYEDADQQVDRLLMANGGHSDNMNASDLARYRALASRRDELQNQVRAMEVELQFDEDSLA